MNALATTARDGITAWLCQQLSRQMQQLVALVESHCRLQSRPVSAVNEIVMVGTAITQLTSWLPAEQELKPGLQKLARILPALLQTRDSASLMRLLQWLYALQQQLQPAAGLVAAALWLLQKPAGKAAPSIAAWLASWLRQQQREVVAGVVTTHGVYTTFAASAQAQLLQQLISRWRSNDLTPPVLSTLLRQLRALLHFTADMEMQHDFDDVAAQLGVMFVHPPLGSDAAQLQCWETLFLLLQAQPRRRPQVSPCADIELLQAAQTDLSRYRPRLDHFLQQAAANSTTLLSQDVMTLHYKLPWILAAAGQTALARLYHCWYQLLLLYWKYKAPLPAAALDLLTQTTATLNLQQWSTLTAAQTLDWQLRLLQLWPTVPATAVQQVALPPTTASLVELTAIPVLLSRSFDSLCNCNAEWFVDVAALSPHHAALQEELLLLEKGAAAVRIHEVEIFCSQLLALHHKVGLQPQGFPGALLWRSHQHLLALLDEAAAWQPPQLDLTLIAEMKRWLQDRHGDYWPVMVREPALSPLQSADALLQRLREFVDAVVLLIDQPLRFDATVVSPLSVAALPACELALKPLLLALILEQAHATDQRREALRPHATVIGVVLAETAEGIWIDVSDEGHDSISPQHTLKRLRARLPDCVVQLSSETTPGFGRRFRLLIKAETS